MEIQNDPKLSKGYFFAVLLMMLILPVISIVVGSGNSHSFSMMLVGKWFTFWAIGVRLFVAGLRQVINPGFTAQDIFHLEGTETHVIVRELGLANICFGLAGISSLVWPQFRMGAAFTGGLYLGIAGIQHIIKKPTTPNEMLALVSDIFIFLVMIGYVVIMLNGAASLAISN